MATVLTQGPESAALFPARALSLTQNFAWTTVGNAAYACCQWAIVCLFAKLGSPEMVGQYALGLAVTAPVLMLGQLNLRAVLATDVARKFAVRDYCGLRLTVTAISLLATAVISKVAGYSYQATLVIMAVGVAQYVESISDIYYGVLQLHERMERIAISMMARGLLSVCAIGLEIYFTHSVLRAVIALVCARALILVFYDSRYALRDLPDSSLSMRDQLTRDKLADRVRNQLRIAWIALPLGIVLMLGSLSTNIPRYFIEHYAGNRELGIFSAVASLLNVSKTFVNGLGQASMPRLAKLFATRELRAFMLIAARLLGLGAALGIAGILAGAWIGGDVLSLMYKPEYAAYSGLLLALLAVSLFDNLGSLLGYTITAARCFRSQIPLLVATTAATALGSLLFIPVYGLTGAALALGLGSIVQAAGSGLILWRAVRLNAH